MQLAERVRRGQPWVVLVPLVALQWAAVLAFALSVQRNGWLFYQGGDQTYYYTGAWLLTQGELPTAYVGYGWSVLLAPIALFAGPDVLAALPAIVLLQVGLLLPVALLCVYGIAAAIGGRPIGYLAATAWVAAPYAAIPLFDERYHDRYVEQFLPQALGLTALADFPSMVLVLVSAFFVVRALGKPWGADALLAGLAAGFAAAVKPANLLFLAGPALAFALARQARPLAAFGLAVTPPLATLALWKWLGLGYLPALAAEEARLAAAAGHSAAQPLAALPGPLGRYVDIDWSTLHRNYLEFREYFWSVRIVQWLPLAGLVAVARRSPPIAGLLGGWFAAFLVIKGTYPLATVATGSFFRFLMPAFPAYLLLAVAIPLLAPVWGRALARRVSAAAAELPRRPLVVGAAAVALVLAPLALIALAARPPGEQAVLHAEANLLIPIDPELGVQAEDGRLTWSDHRGGPAVFYRVLRARAGTGVDCVGPAEPVCVLEMDVVATTREPTWPLPDGEDGSAFRIGVAANWRDDPELGDVLVLSPPAALPRS